DRLIRVNEHRRAALAGEARDAFDVQAAAVPEADVRRGYERRSLVDRVGEALQRDRPVALGGNVDDPDAASLLRVPDLADRRKLEVADDDGVASLVEAQPAGERAHARGDRRPGRALVPPRGHRS